MKPKQLRGIGKASSGRLLPHFAGRGRSASNPGIPQAPTVAPVPLQPQVQLPPVRSGIYCHTGWQILEEPLIYPQHQGVLFTRFKNMFSVQLTRRNNQINFKNLEDEINTLTNAPGRKIVLEMPNIFATKDVEDLINNLDRTLRITGGKLVLYYPSSSVSSPLLQPGFIHISTSNDRDHAGQIALGINPNQGSTGPQTTGNNIPVSVP